MKRQAFALIFAFVLLKFVLQFTLLHPDYELHRDEYMHLDLARHMAWGYFSVPPFIAGLAFLIQALGNGEFWVHFFPALAGAVTLFWAMEFVRREGGGGFALCLSGVLLVFSPLLRLNGLFQPNSFDVMAWTGVYFYLYLYFKEAQPRFLYWSAFFLALGFLNKYNVFFLVMGLVPALALRPERKLFTQPHLYGALFLFLLCVGPNLHWQYRHDFPVLEHMRLLRTQHLVHVERSDFLIKQALFVFCSLPFLWGLWKARREQGWFLLSVLFSLVFFLYFRAKPYYALGLYPFLWALSALYFSKTVRGRWRWALLLWPIGFTLLSISDSYPVYSPQKLQEMALKSGREHRWEDGSAHLLSQDFADMVGWRELAEKTEKALAAFPDKNRVLVLCDNYGQAGAIHYYTQGRVKAQSFHGDYGVWLDTETPYRHLLRIKSAEGREEELNETAPHFQTAQKVDSLENPLAREYLTTIFVFREAKYPFNAFLKEEQKAEVYPGLLKK